MICITLFFSTAALKFPRLLKNDEKLKGAVYAIAFCIGSEIAYKLYKRWKCKNCANTNNANKITKVLFFPDKLVACHDFFISGDGCFKNHCNFSHSATSLSNLYAIMLSCKHTFDVCVYVLSCKDLCAILLKLHKRGVKIRIITDKDMLKCDGSQVWNLQQNGKNKDMIFTE